MNEKNDRCAEIAERIRAREREQKEARKIAKLSGKVQLVKHSCYYYGKTASGKHAVFTPDNGYSIQSLYNVGTLVIDGKTMFTKGYMSKALEVMARN